jgi:two-component sensor histidine kinase
VRTWCGRPRFNPLWRRYQCGDHAINGVALVFHELATNAVKYGALSVDEGRVDVSWVNADGKLILRWVEKGGPWIEAPPTTNDFGGALAQVTTVRQFGGTLDCEWHREGVVVTITIPISSLSA